MGEAILYFVYQFPKLACGFGIDWFCERTYWIYLIKMKKKKKIALHRQRRKYERQKMMKKLIKKRVKKNKMRAKDRQMENFLNGNEQKTGKKQAKMGKNGRKKSKKWAKRRLI